MYQVVNRARHHLFIVTALMAALMSTAIPFITKAQADSPILYIGSCLVTGTNTFRWQGLNGPVAAEWRLQLQPNGPTINLGLLQPGDIVGGYTADILTTTTEGIWKKQHFDGTNWISAIGQNFTSVSEHTNQGLFCPNFAAAAVSPTPTPSPSPSPTDNPRGDEQDCCLGPDPVEPTPAKKPVSKSAAVKGTTVAATPTPSIAPITKFPSAGPSITHLILHVLDLVF